MYAIAFDLDMDTLSQTYGNPSYTNAYTDIKNTLAPFGFTRQQGSVYFGMEADAVKTVVAAQTLAKRYSWFAPSIKDIQMLRIEENSDLMPALEIFIKKEERYNLLLFNVFNQNLLYELKGIQNLCLTLPVSCGNIIMVMSKHICASSGM